MIRRCSTLVAVVLPLLAGCGAGEGSGAPVWAGTRDTIDDVEVVRNPVSSLYDSAAVEVARLWTAPSAEDRERRGLWERPTRVRVDARRAYVLDDRAHRIYGIDASTGEWHRTIGREGGGPGEFERPFGVAVAGGRLAVGNSGGASIEVLDTAGAYVRTIRIGMVAFSLWPLEGRRHLVSGVLGDEGGLYLVGSDGDAEGLTFPEPVTEPPYGVDDCGPSVPAGTRIVRLACYEPVLYVAGLDGRLVREVHVDRPLTEADPALVDEHARRIGRLMGRSGLPAGVIQRQVERFRDRYRYIPRFGRPRYDRATRRYAVLEQMPSDLGGGPATVHLFSVDGVFLASLPFEHGWLDYATHDAVLYALVEDPATGLVRLTAYRYRIPDMGRGG